MASAFDPYYEWLGIQPKDQPPNHYRLLGVELFEPNTSAIANAADRQMAHLKACSTGPQALLSQKLLNEVSAARLCLLNQQARVKYDEQLRAKLPASPAVVPIAAKPVVLIPDPAAARQLGTRASSSTLPVAKPLVTPEPFRKRSLPPKVKAKQPLVLGAVAVIVLSLVGIAVFLLTRGDESVVANAPLHPVQPSPSPAKPTVARPTTPRESLRQSETRLPVRQRVIVDTGGTTSTNDSSSTESRGKSGKPNRNDPNDVASKSNPQSAADTANSMPRIAVEAPAPDNVASQSNRLPPPDVQQQQTARKLLREAFAEALAQAKKPEDRLKLAKDFLTRGREMQESPTDRYVLLVEAGELAAQSGSGALIAESTAALAEFYDVDPVSIKSRLLSSAAKFTFDARTSNEFVAQILAAADESIVADRFEDATSLVKTAQNVARKFKDKEVLKAVAAKVREVEVRRQPFDAAEKAAQVLAEKPDDPAANLTRGQWLCLVKGDWNQGLLMLAKSPSPKLQAAAKADLANPTDSAARLKVGDAWYDVATADKGVKGFYTRAHFWYDAAQADLSGLAKARLAKRLDEIAVYAKPMTAQTIAAGKSAAISAKLRTSIAAHAQGVAAVAFSPDGKTLASGSGDNSIKLWAVATGESTRTLAGHTKGISSVAFVTGGKTLVSASGDFSARFWDVATGKQLRDTPQAQRIALSRDGKTLGVINSQNGQISLWNAVNGQALGNYAGSAPCWWALAVSSDGKMLAGLSDHAIYVWNTQTRKLLQTLDVHATPINGLAFAPDGKYLAVVNGSGVMPIWNLATGTEQRSIKAESQSFKCVDYAPDGQTLATGSIGMICLWNPHTGDMRQELRSHEDSVWAVVFSPDGKLIASAGEDHTVKIWDLKMDSGEAGSAAVK